MSRFDGRVALLSGALAALGRASVAEGGKVVIGDLLDKDGQALTREIGQAATCVNGSPVSLAEYMCKLQPAA